MVYLAAFNLVWSILSFVLWVFDRKTPASTRGTAILLMLSMIAFLALYLAGVR